MKKLYLSITLLFIMILMFAVTMIPTKAYQGLTLDTQIVELNNLTLKDVFQTGNEFVSVDSSTDFWRGINRFSGNYLVVQGTATGVYDRRISEYMNNDGEYYINGLGYNDNNSNTKVQVRKNNMINYVDQSVNGESIRFVFNQSLDTNFGINLVVSTGLSINMILGPTIVNLTDYGLEQANTTLLDYYYDIYISLLQGINIQTFYNDGENNGYDAGYDTGYDTGYDAGLIIGEDIGYNNGVDYAVQQNISILSIFELIFGVALNMLTFIITIDIFGISILSLISVLSLFVGVVWILKMIRG